jgi:hypothetical protein
MGFLIDPPSKAPAWLRRLTPEQMTALTQPSPPRPKHSHGKQRSGRAVAADAILLVRMEEAKASGESFAKLAKKLHQESAAAGKPLAYGSSPAAILRRIFRLRASGASILGAV